MRFKPLHDYIVIEIEEVENMTASGILIPDETLEDSEDNTFGVVAAVGEGKNGKLPVEVGQTVMFKKWGGEVIELDNKKYKVVTIHDVLGILN